MSNPDTNQASEVEAELMQTMDNLNGLFRRAAIIVYNFERSFVINVKEVSGKGLTAEEARKKWGLE